MDGVTALAAETVTLGKPRKVEASQAARVRALLVRYESDVHRLVRHLLGPDPECEDVVQDVFLRLVTSWRSLREPDRERAWVTTITVNVVRNQLRRRRVRRIIELRPDPPERVHVVEPQWLTRDLMRRGYRLLDRLRPGDRIALVLRRVEGRSIDEVAEVCNCSPATVKRRVRRAETKLASLLEKDPDLHQEIRGENDE